MCDYFSSLQETIEYEAGQVLEDTLNQSLASGLADEIAQAVIDSERHGFRTVRYLLIDGESGELESRRLFESSAEAEKGSQAYGEKCLVATLLCDC